MRRGKRGNIIEDNFEYEVIDNLSDFLEFYEEHKHIKDFSFDTETTSLSYYNLNITAISFYGSEFTKAYAILFNFECTYTIKVQDPENRRRKKAVERLFTKTDAVNIWEAAPYLAEWFEGALCTCANGKFDRKVANKYGFDGFTLKDDTNTLAHYIDSSQPKGLKPNTEKYLGIKMTSYEETIGQKPDNINWTLVDFDEYGRYSAFDPYCTYYLSKELLTIIKELGNDKVDVYRSYCDIGIPISKVTAEMEMNGVYINKEKLLSMSKRIEIRVAQLQETIYSMSGHEFNIGSGDQLAQVLFNSLEYPIIKKTAGGKPSTNQETMDTLAFKGYELPPYILEYKRLVKLKTTYVDAIPKMVDADGLLRAGFNENGTQCIVGSSLVVTDFGLRRIEDCNKHTVVINKNLKPERAEDFVIFENRGTLKITTNLGFEIEGVPEHKIIYNRYAYNDYLKDSHQWIKLEGLETGQRIVIPYGYKKFGLGEAHIKYNRTGRFRGKPVRLPVYMSQAYAEFIGIYNADGIIKDSNGSFTIHICNSRPEVQQRVVDLALKLFNIQPNVYSYGVSITSIQLAPIEKALNLGRGDENKTIPKEVLMGDKYELMAYMRGLTLDGHVVNEKGKSYFDWTITNENHAKEVHNILLNFGYISSLRKDRNAYNICIYNDFGYAFLTEIGSVKEQKEFVHKTRLKSNFFRFSKFRNGCIEVKVKSIKKGKSTVYDFVLPKTHSFLANSMINHNTGRFSSSKPNLQNQPNDKEFPVRDAFEARADDRILLVGDYSQIELRMLAHMTQDPYLIKCYKENLDVHQMTADLISKITGVEISRSMGKTINFALVFLMGPESLANRLNLAMAQAVVSGELDREDFLERKVSLKQGRQIRTGYFRSYTGFDKYVASVAKRTQALGYSYTLSGFSRPIPEINDKKFFSSGRRKAINTAIQGSAADLIKLTMIKVAHEITTRTLDCKLILQVHDELVYDVPKVKADEHGAMIKEAAENIFPKCRVPLIFDMIQADSWYEMKGGKKTELQAAILASDLIKLGVI